ncbi:HD domain-containing protein [Brevibacillus invocatus]|uniref:HD domain-containing protein n=1 Tax=Brevibacillus invocatus TaxID=173959 RepID=UPI00203BC7DA|nr:HD domain-containing protein [Brevibacillus invocatus]MCM3082030.1 HD domain-containing protein [Brevibacillus invocatus]MCM3432436.1 HD domain-containing protein [Brevibacillus invocatus]
MKLYDELYGQYEVEDVLAEIINTETIQRLKNIHQAGAAYLVNNEWNVTRYEHSLGVMLLIRKLGGTIEEQIAGLLHDVSHTAFSHVVDFVFDIKEQNYHEKIFENVVMNSEIPAILTKHDINLDDIFNIDMWSILEQPLPKLCADRLDYTLRDMYYYFGTTQQEVVTFLESLKIVNGEICVSSVEMAEWFTTIYYKLVIDYFLSPLNVYSYHSLANIISLSLKKGILNLDQLLLNDPTVLNIIKSSNDSEVLHLLEFLTSKVELEENEANYDFHMVGKARIIDVPVSFDNTTIHNSSTLSPKVRKMNEEAMEKSNRGTFVKIKTPMIPITF